MSSLRTQLMDKVVAALGATGKPSGLLVERRTKVAAESSQLPKLMVSRAKEEVHKAVPNRKSPLVERKLTLRLDCWATGADAEEALEAILIWITGVMQADQSWGNLAMETDEETTEWDAAIEDLTLGHAWVEYSIRYTTKTADQEVKQ